MPRTNVLFASLPFSSLHYPSIGLSLLKSALGRAGVPCRVRYFFLDYADAIGRELTDLITGFGLYKAQLGEWVFSELAEPRGEERDLRYFTEVLQRDFPEAYSASLVLSLLEAREAAETFIERCADEVVESGCSILGLTTSFQQNMASLALAQRIKARQPDILTVLGGANCRGEMGIELLRRFSFIDAVCLDEGDRVFPELVRRHAVDIGFDGIPALAFRSGDDITVPLQTIDAIADLDSLPYPDFSDFFEQHRRSAVAGAHYAPVALFETSRGCWWGAVHHCTFCGINGLSMAYRSKSQGRAYDELEFLVSRYGGDIVHVDSILDMRYFEELLPRLAADGPEITMYCELKANLKPEQLTLLSKAGLKKIQPGIESFSSDILKLMAKGCTALQNVQVLKLAAENGLFVEWNLLYGFPGETAAHYDEIAALLPKLRHLQPATALWRVRADRFSPYFSAPAKYGIELDPFPAYRFLYPFDEATVRRLAYHFDLRSDALDAVDEYTRGTAAEYAAWKEHQCESALFCEDDGEIVTVVDERRGMPRETYRLTGIAAVIYRLCWKITPLRILRAATRDYGEGALETALGQLVSLGLLLREGENCLALALRQPGFRRAPSWEEIRAGEITPFALRETEPAELEPAL